MTKRPIRLIPAAILVAAGALLVGVSNALGTSTHGTSNSQTYTDSTGETPGAPDISTIKVSNNDAGDITLRINVPNRPVLTQDMAIFVFLDTDNKTSTGDPRDAGADYVLQLFPGNVELFPWKGSNYGQAVQTPSLTYAYAAGAATFHLSDSAIGNSKEFDFFAIVESGITVDENGNPVTTNALFDQAPDPGHGTYQYNVLTTLRIDATRFEISPKPVERGETFSAALAVIENDTGGPVVSGVVSCTATIAGKHLAAGHKGGIANGIATCIWSVPKQVKGRTILGTITVTVRGVSVHRSFAARIG